MSATPAMRRARGLRPTDVPTVVDLLQSDFGRWPGGGGLANQFLLDALDRGERDRFAIWPDRDPAAVVYVGSTGTVVPAGDAAGAEALAGVVEGTSWRVLIGVAPLAQGIVDVCARGIFRRRANAREQRFLVAEATPAITEVPAGMRRADLGDLAAVTQFACALHVEDEMGPPIPRAGRASVQGRMRDSILRGATYVVERDQRPVAKLDLSIRSAVRGAQIAGVYVDPGWRGRGIGSQLVSAVTRQLLDEGLPGVTLHVRSGNAPAIRAYDRAGYRDRGAWLLALR